MRILKHGNPYVKKFMVYKVRCPYCGCVFIFNEDEYSQHLFIEPLVGSDEERERIRRNPHIHFECSCPDCSKMIADKYTSNVELVPLTSK